jgi:hypothetical protein
MRPLLWSPSLQAPWPPSRLSLREAIPIPRSAAKPRQIRPRGLHLSVQDWCRSAVWQGRVTPGIYKDSEACALSTALSAALSRGDCDPRGRQAVTRTPLLRTAGCATLDKATRYKGGAAYRTESKPASAMDVPQMAPLSLDCLPVICSIEMLHSRIFSSNFSL